MFEKAFLHWYQMQEEEFAQASESVNIIQN